LSDWRRCDQLYQAHLHSNRDHRQLIDDIITLAKKSTELTQVDLGVFLRPLAAHDLKPRAPAVWGKSYQRYRQSPEFKAYMINSGIHQYWLETDFPF
jgi:hypothetical protein